jgi:hypothetical protein
MDVSLSCLGDRDNWQGLQDFRKEKSQFFPLFILFTYAILWHILFFAKRIFPNHHLLSWPAAPGEERNGSGLNQNAGMFPAGPEQVEAGKCAES